MIHPIPSLRRPRHALLLAITLLLTGCAPSPPKPLDNQTLDTLSRGLKPSPALVISQSGKQQKYLLTDNSATNILQALLPIKSSTDAGIAFPKVTIYQLSYEAKDPVEYMIAIDGEQLLFSERNFTYTGGNVNKFKATIDKITAGEGKPVP